jgi:hypothetical protein
MAAGDKKAPDESDDASPAPRTPDVRVSAHDDMGVRVSRDLNASGPVARGYNSNMSKLNFSSRGVPREEVVDNEDAAPVRPVAAAPVKPPAPVAPPAAPAEPASGGALSWLTGLFTRR